MNNCVNHLKIKVGIIKWCISKRNHNVPLSFISIFMLSSRFSHLTQPNLGLIFGIKVTTADHTHVYFFVKLDVENFMCFP